VRGGVLVKIDSAGLDERTPTGNLLASSAAQAIERSRRNYGEVRARARAEALGRVAIPAVSGRRAPTPARVTRLAQMAEGTGSTSAPRIEVGGTFREQRATIR